VAHVKTKYTISLGACKRHQALIELDSRIFIIKCHSLLVHWREWNMAKRLIVITLSILLMSFMCAVALPRAFAADPTRVYVDPPKIDDTGLVPNTKFNVSVRVDNVPADPGLVGVEFRLKWDPALLNVTTFQEMLFHNVTPVDFWPNIWSLKLQTNNTGGYVQYAQTWQDINQAIADGYAPASGNYVVANIVFNVKGTGKCALHLEGVKLGDPNANVLPAETTDGSFSNLGAPPPPKQALIYVDPAKIANASLTSGSTFSVNIGIINASGVAGLEFKLNFNSTALNAQSVTRGSFIPPSVTPTTQIDNTTGFVKYNVSLSTPLDGSGTVAAIQFQVMADNVKNSTLHISDVVLVDNSSQALPFTTADGSFANLKTLPGDLNQDSAVDINDAILAANAFGTKDGDPNWNPAADFDNNGEVDIFDLILIAQNFGRKL